MIYIILLNWKNARDTIACLSSLQNLSNEEKFRVVVVDNCSDDGSYEIIKNHLVTSALIRRCGQFRETSAADVSATIDSPDTGLVLIQSGANLGFAGGNNVGLRFALAQGDMEFAWLLNNDTEVTPDSLALICESSRHNPLIGICGSKLVYWSERDNVQALGGVYNPWLAISKHVGAHTSPDQTYDDESVSNTLDYIVGASMLVSKDFLKTVGLMSEEFFLYFEELDWAIRAKKNGYQLHVVTSSLVYHKEGGTINNGLTRRSVVSEFYYLRNRLLITKKYFPAHLPFVWTVGVAIAIRRLLKGDTRGAKIGFNVLFSSKWRPW